MSFHYTHLVTFYADNLLTFFSKIILIFLDLQVTWTVCEEVSGLSAGLLETHHKLLDLFHGIGLSVRPCGSSYLIRTNTLSKLRPVIEGAKIQVPKEHRSTILKVAT
jgi:hypothetical protein